MEDLYQHGQLLIVQTIKFDHHHDLNHESASLFHKNMDPTTHVRVLGKCHRAGEAVQEHPREMPWPIDVIITRDQEGLTTRDHQECHRMKCACRREMHHRMGHLLDGTRVHLCLSLARSIVEVMPTALHPCHHLPILTEVMEEWNAIHLPSSAVHHQLRPANQEHLVLILNAWH